MARPPKRPRVVWVDDWQSGAEKDPGFVTALARGLELLRAFGPDDDLLGNGELAERTGIPRSTVSRLTQTLTALGYLRYLPRFEKYQLGAGVLALGYRYLSISGVRDVARPHMQALANANDCTVALGVPDRLSMIYTEVCYGGPVVLRIGVGSRVPIALTSMGRAYFAALPDAEREALRRQIRDHAPDEWNRARKALDAAERQYQETGFCISIGEWQRRVGAVGAAMPLDGGSNIMAFNCGGHVSRMTREVLETEIGPKVLDLVNAVRQDMFAATNRIRIDA